MRQTGKTTLLRDSAATIIRFDQESNVLKFSRESEDILTRGPFPILLDEVQKCPSAFDEVKAQVDQRKTPGRFLMTGSVRFSLKREIRESMTGRMITLELLPLGVAEAHRQKLSNAFELITAETDNEENILENLANRQWITREKLEQHLKTGGLPGICFSRDPSVRAELMESHLDTLLGRDLYQLYQSQLSSARLRTLLQLLAKSAGHPINRSQLARELSTTSPTILAHLKAFEALFLIRPLDQGYYIEDQGLCSHLCQFDRLTDLANLRRLVFSEVQQQLHYRFRSQAQLSSYTSTSGNSIPFVLKFSTGKTLAIILDEGDYPSNSSLKVATWFQKKHGEKAICLILHLGKNGVVVKPRVLAMPHLWIF